MTPITPRLLASLSVKEKPELMVPLAAAMNEFFPLYEITNEKRIEHFLAQALHEADGFRTLQEYATGDAYDTRTDLGNTPQRDGDGRKYKGHGIFQTTGKTNHARAGKVMGIDAVKHPELLATPRYAVWSACIYWKDRKLNALADADNIRAITKKINGGYNGLDDRMRYLERCRAVIIDDAKPAGLVTPASPPAAIRAMQKLLKERNYQPGGLDGKWGRMTRDAVMAFKADNFLDVTEHSVNLGDIMAAGPRIIPARKDATVADLRENGSTTVKGADKVQIASGGATVAALGGSYLSQAEDAAGYWYRFSSLLEPFQEVFSWLLSNPLLLVLPIALVAGYYAHKIKVKRLEEFKAGKVQ